MRTKSRLPTVFASLCLLLGGVLGLAAAPSSATYVYIFEEDFDGAWPPEFYVINPSPGSWKVVDNNAASGLDYWGRSSYRAQAGTYSAWCAQNGVNSLNLQANSLNHYYDQDMQACMMVYLGNVEGYGSLLLSFAYWAKTGTESPNDHLEVRAFTGSAWVDLWTQPDVGSMTWEWVTSTLPLTTIWVGWFFFSDAEVGLGPYEGVYVDSIQIAGNDVERPASSTGPLDLYWVGDTIYVPYLANDSFGSGVKFVELYYRYNATGSFQKYAPPENPSGEWSSGLIPFNTTTIGGDGTYEFYTLATDYALNKELAPGSADAYAVLDNSRPSTAALAIETPNIHGWYRVDAHVFLSPHDTGSGVENTWYRIGTEDWQAYGDGIVVSADGIHQLQFYSEDRAGNKEQVRTLELCLDRQSPSLEVTGPADGVELESGEILISWECSDETSGVDRVVVTVDGEFSEYCNASTHNLLLSGLEPGEHSILLTAVDRAGNSAEVYMNFEVLSDEEVGAIANLWPLITIVGVVVFLATVLALLLRARRGVTGGRRERRLGKEEAGKGAEPMSSAAESAPAKEDTPREVTGGREERRLGKEEAGKGAEPMSSAAESAPAKKQKPKR